MNKIFLLQLHKHVLEIRLWPSVNKVSARACYDRPKAFRLPAQTEEDMDSREMSMHPAKFPEVSHNQKIRNSRGQSTRDKKTLGAIPMEVSQLTVQTNESSGKDTSV